MSFTASRALSLTLSSALAVGALSGCGDDEPNNDNPDNMMPNGQLTDIVAGTLSGDGAGGAPDATGSIRIARDASGSRFVILGANFAQEMGPGDTQLFLARADGSIADQRSADGSSVSEVIGTVPNGFSGERTFPLPAGIDLGSFGYLIVWCPTAGVNFGAASIDGSSQASMLVRSGSLVGDGSGGAPDATGTVRVVREGSGLAIELGEDFAQEMGPGDTQVILARTADNVQTQRDADAASASASIGVIPNGASGARSFTLPASIDLDDFDHVIIWCPTAGVNFGAAELPKRAGTLAGDGAGGAPDASGAVSLNRAGTQLTLDMGSDFVQEMGPGDTQVFLARGNGSINDQRGADPASVSAVVGTIANGATGAMSLTIPAEISVDQFDYVVVWCPTAGVNFGAARLQ